MLSHEESRSKKYIGDGVYVCCDGFNIWLTAEDGVSIQNAVCMEPSVWNNLLVWVQQRRKDGDIPLY